MRNKLTIVANAGRSGSTFLYKLLKENEAAPTIFHEDIPVQTSKPRQYNRAYTECEINQVLNDTLLSQHLHLWREKLKSGDVIETGWTSYHLLPVLHHQFKDQLQVIVMHRDPWSVALSRANMGNYHARSWYDDSHEVSPFDKRTIAPDYKNLWKAMNHAEKCLFWWYVVYREIDEFLKVFPNVPHISIASTNLFNGSAVPCLSNFLGVYLERMDELEKNPVQRFVLETFPITDEYKNFNQHPQINSYAFDRFGYLFDEQKIMKQSMKYRLPPGILPRLRNNFNYWSHKRKMGQLVRILSGTK